MLTWWEAYGMSEAWRKVKVPDPDGDVGYLLLPPDGDAVGPIWAAESFVDHLVYCLNLEAGLDHFDIVFEPAKPKPRTRRKRTT